jgi:hypothetical protein
MRQRCLVGSESACCVVGVNVYSSGTCRRFGVSVNVEFHSVHQRIVVKIIALH